jgi:hypothetical protein
MENKKLEYKGSAVKKIDPEKRKKIKKLVQELKSKHKQALKEKDKEPKRKKQDELILVGPKGGKFVQTSTGGRRYVEGVEKSLELFLRKNKNSDSKS